MREITIHRNFIERNLMRVKDFVKQNTKAVLYSSLAVIVIIIIVITAIVIVEKNAQSDLFRFESVMEKYRAIDKSDLKNNDQLKKIYEDTIRSIRAITF